MHDDTVEGEGQYVNALPIKDGALGFPWLLTTINFIITSDFISCMGWAEVKQGFYCVEG